MVLRCSVIKFVIHQIKSPLTHIFNLSIKFGIFPDKLKISKVIPVHKANSKSNMNNYRPISLLPVFSKILEKIIQKRLNQFLHDNNILSSVQHGFIKLKSTTSATLNLTDHMLNSFDHNLFSVGVFLDLSKAFDCVNHDILIHKLEHIGIRQTSLNLIKSYLSNRKQFVHFNNTNSSFKILTHSVPQGSILGPLLFNIYINDIKNSVNKLKLVLYADDSCFYQSHHEIHTLINLVNLELNFVNDWLTANKLTLNVKKSHYLIFSRQKTIPLDIPPVKINENILDLKQSTNYLGLNIQNNLKWDNHIDYLTNKLHKYNSILYLTRNCLTRSSLITIYNSIIYSCLTYSNAIWGYTSKSNTNKLFMAQKKIIRTIMYRNKFYHTNTDFFNLNILKINEINKYFAGIFVYKSLNNLCFPINYFFNVEFHVPTYNLRNLPNLRPPQVHTIQSMTSPSFYCCHIWNNIPLDIRRRLSVPSFKYALKQHLLNIYNS